MTPGLFQTSSELESECELVEDSDDAEEEDEVEDAKVEEVEENNWEEEVKDELDGSADDADGMDSDCSSSSSSSSSSSGCHEDELDEDGKNVSEDDSHVEDEEEGDDDEDDNDHVDDVEGVSVCEESGSSEELWVSDGKDEVENLEDDVVGSDENVSRLWVFMLDELEKDGKVEELGKSLSGHDSDEGGNVDREGDELGTDTVGSEEGISDVSSKTEEDDVGDDDEEGMVDEVVGGSEVEGDCAEDIVGSSGRSEVLKLSSCDPEDGENEREEENAEENVGSVEGPDNVVVDKDDGTVEDKDEMVNDDDDDDDDAVVDADKVGEEDGKASSLEVAVAVADGSWVRFVRA
ncbi:hypothetical protein ACI3LY_002911 [Candidozyma auris]